jgi:WW domain-containing oxidoreductase
MKHVIPFGARSTADQVLAGVDLTRKTIVVTECDSDVGFETMNALAANGAHVIGLARTLEVAHSACKAASTSATPVACDMTSLESVYSTAQTIRSLSGQLDAVITNEGPPLPNLQTCYGIERQFFSDHIAHFLLINSLIEVIRRGTGRIIIASGDAGMKHAPAEGVMFDNLDGRQFYDHKTFYGQAKFATALYAKELSRRLACCGVAVNSFHTGVAKEQGSNRIRRIALSILMTRARLWMISAAQIAATPALLAASPRVVGVTGEYWSGCRISKGNPMLGNTELANRLWDTSAQIITRSAAANQDQFNGPIPQTRVNPFNIVRNRNVNDGGYSWEPNHTRMPPWNIKIDSCDLEV